MSENGPMTVLEHLVELRQRLIKAILSLVITTLVSLLFTRRLLILLTALMGDNLPQATRPTETIVIYFKVALIGGLVLAMPVIVYQLIRFLVPGLYPHERRYLYVIVPAASLLFASGVAFPITSCCQRPSPICKTSWVTSSSSDGLSKTTCLW